MSVSGTSSSATSIPSPRTPVIADPQTPSLVVDVSEDESTEIRPDARDADSVVTVEATASDGRLACPVLPCTKSDLHMDPTNEAKRLKTDSVASPDSLGMHQLLEKLGHELEQAKRLATAQEAVAASTAEELRKFKGEEAALRTLAAADLARLGEHLVMVIGRVQREQLWRFTQQLDERLCRVCLVEQRNVVVQPCNHCAMCSACFQKCHSKCPQCRAPISGHLQVYL
eukprot:TRINITY_DN68591_c0_g1_i1.p1 TRINITY_DN68591_c0_g1~~TRINITY_DN68591_c0_g1_i1.p1  ORF type:complete len:239 (+),score=36.69 TRINITY_DN68591_c0_g1_i1:36-719(+)